MEHTISFDTGDTKSKAWRHRDNTNRRYHLARFICKTRPGVIALTPCKTILAAISLTLTMSAASAAEQAPTASAFSMSEACVGCPAYFVVSASLVPEQIEPESYAMRGDNNAAREITTPSPTADNRLAARQESTVVGDHAN